MKNRLSMRKFSQSAPETIQKAQAGDESAIAQVIEENTGLITDILMKWNFKPKSAEFEDLMSDIKVEMLNKVIPRYDPSRGAFSTFLSTAVYNFLKNKMLGKEYKEKQKEVSLTAPIGDEITYEDILEDPTSPLAQLTLNSIREGFQTWLHTENPKLEDVILRIFDLKLQEYPHEQIAEILNQEGYTSKGKPVTKNMVSNYFRKWIKPALAQYFEAFRTASLSMRKKSQEEEEDLNGENWETEEDFWKQKPSKYEEKRSKKLPEKEFNKKWKDVVRFTPEQAAEYLRDSGMVVKKVEKGYLFGDPLGPEEDFVVWSGKKLADYVTDEWDEDKVADGLTEESVLYGPFLRKYTGFEILDIASGKKTDVTKEERKLAKEVVRKEIVTKETAEEALEQTKMKEELEKPVEVPYAELLSKYTEDEIYDIAAGRKTDVTEEEVTMAKEVIQRGIVANRLSMRKKVNNE